MLCSPGVQGNFNNKRGFGNTHYSRPHVQVSVVWGLNLRASWRNTTSKAPTATWRICGGKAKYGEKEAEGLKMFGQRHRCPICGEAFRKLSTMLLHVREDHPDEDKEDKTEVKEQDEVENMLCESDMVEKEDQADKEAEENLETTVDGAVAAAEEETEISKEDELLMVELEAEESSESPVKDAESSESPMKEEESPKSPIVEADRKMAEDMDNIIKICKEIDEHAARKEAEKELKSLARLKLPRRRSIMSWKSWGS